MANVTNNPNSDATMKTLNLPRIEDRFPTIYITLISVLLAVGLEDAISQLRELGTTDPYNLAVVFYVAATILAAWTGYSFVAITQARRPRLLDSVNVFGLALGILVLNSTIGQPTYWFFAAVTLYMVLAVYAVIYNMNLMAEVVPVEFNFRHWSPCIWSVVLYAPPYAVFSWLSFRGDLGNDLEMLFVFLAMTQPILWAMAFYRVWKDAMDRSAEAMGVESQ